MSEVEGKAMTNPMPAIFFGHGNPLNALVRNDWTEGWAAIGANIPRPRAVLCVSAHWYLPGTCVTAMSAPRTIHDFGGFPRELYEVKYTAPGDPELANRVRELLAPLHVGLDMRWGLDHGSWSVLCHVFPEADVPVVQLSIDETQTPDFHYETAKRLAPLRDEGVLVLGSGNVVHNLHAYAWGRHPVEPFDWAVRFDERVRALLLAGDDAPLVAYESMGRDALMSVPTPEHYLPLLYVLAMRREGDEVNFPVEGFDGGSISMLSVRVG
ncbi:MAG TPA: 4,5-DOPA dioxygenase extradiol [Pyrinomonadaceae bacterium]|nr:4,5-DOPA dioxygenase extradiol [Pyrinomonadaceae bacterium]